jgi:hypothetical protein
MSWRVTFSKLPRDMLLSVNKNNGTVIGGVLFKVTERVELRDDTGTIIRLDNGAEFEIKNSPLGYRPEYFGAVYISRQRTGGKYRTSCWLAPANPFSMQPDIFIKPSNLANVDEFYAISGDIVIYEFDEKLRTFTICTIHEGEKALILFNSKAENIKNRYKANITQYSDSEYEYILKNFIDRRKWM